MKPSGRNHITFTGSADTAEAIARHGNFIQNDKNRQKKEKERMKEKIVEKRQCAPAERWSVQRESA